MMANEFLETVEKLNSVIQRVVEELGSANADFSEKVMDSAHDLLQACSVELAAGFSTQKNSAARSQLLLIRIVTRSSSFGGHPVVSVTVDY